MKAVSSADVRERFSRSILAIDSKRDSPTSSWLRREFQFSVPIQRVYRATHPKASFIENPAWLLGVERPRLFVPIENEKNRRDRYVRVGREGRSDGSAITNQPRNGISFAIRPTIYFANWIFHERRDVSPGRLREKRKFFIAVRSVLRENSSRAVNSGCGARTSRAQPGRSEITNEYISLTVSQRSRP